ncbi:hypothetical protein [Litoribaculum gwangyangense]|uniref:Uncharacterized protein n=1 Tax=Litoribaculum gwangyangense TaxID=1130722 RepID=A0ABP9CTT2_9FLAO
MKKVFLLLCLSTIFTVQAQSDCDDANSYLVNAYSHVKDAYEANNISHLKYYANRSLESFNLSKKSLKNCDCETALVLANKSTDLLAKVEDTQTYEDGRFYVKRARDLSKECIITVDKCSVTNYSNEIATSENRQVSDLQDEQLNLRKQQEALKLKQEKIKIQLEEQKKEELKLKKEQLILSFEAAISENIKTYNETLKVCNCNHNTISVNNPSEALFMKSIKEIKTHYNNNLKTLTSNYLRELNACND